MEYIRKDERKTVDKWKKEKKEIKRFYKKFVKIIVNFKKLNK